MTSLCFLTYDVQLGSGLVVGPLLYIVSCPWTGLNLSDDYPSHCFCFSLGTLPGAAHSDDDAGSSIRFSRDSDARRTQPL